MGAEIFCVYRRSFRAQQSQRNKKTSAADLSFVSARGPAFGIRYCQQAQVNFVWHNAHALHPAGTADPLLAALPDPFYIVDSRDYQLTDLDEERMAATGTQLLCLEKERPHVPLARAVMALRFTPEIFGTQFHPEADGEGMLRYLLTDEKKQQVMENHGEDKYNDMVRQLADPNTIELTESIIVPSFLRRAIAAVPEMAMA